MAFEIYDYVSTVVPDNNVTLSVEPQEVIIEVGEKSGAVHVGDDNSEERISFSDDSVFYVTLVWNTLNEDDSGTLFDFYHSTTKGKGQSKSFKWSSHKDGHTYVVRFASTLTREIKLGGIYGIAQIQFKILGRIAD